MAMMGGGVSRGTRGSDLGNLVTLLEKPSEAKKLLKQLAEEREKLVEERQELTKAKTADEMLKSAAAAKKRADKAVEEARKEADDIRKKAGDGIAARRKALDARELQIADDQAKRAAELQELQVSLQQWRQELGNAASEARAKLENAREVEKKALEKQTRVDAIFEDLKSLKSIRVSVK